MAVSKTLVAGYLLFLGLASTCWAQAPTVDPQLITALKRGGNVIFFRHAATDHSQKDLDTANPDNCAAQRGLTDQGRQQSKSIGENFRRLEIPVGEVFSSRYCRCIETAELAFGKAVPTDDLTSIQNLSTFQVAQHARDLRQRLGTPPEAGTNTVLVSHKELFKKASGIAIEEGEAAVLAPDAQGQFHLLGRITAEQWTDLSL